MSVVAVKVYEKSIIMSADSIIVHGEADKTPIGKGKLFDVNGMIIGTSGWASEGVYLSLYAENHTPLSATERDMMKFFAEFGAWKAKEFGESCKIENQYLIAYKGKCFNVGGGYVAEVTDFYAIGYGHQYSEAALYLGHSPQEAVKVACDLCCFVDGPIVTKTMTKD